MKVNFYATLRHIVGTKTVDLPLNNGCTVRDMVNEMIQRFPALRHELLDDNGQLYSHIHVFINGRDTPYLENRLDTQITEQDTISVFPAVGGG